MPRFGRRQRHAHRLLEGRHVADHVVGRQHQQHRVDRVGVGGEPRVRRARPARWRARCCARTARGSWRAARPAAGAAARPPGSGAPRCTPRSARSGQAVEAQRGLLQHRAQAGERQQLLGIELARQRPQARAGAAREDDWDQHGAAPPHAATQRLAAADGVVGEAEAGHHGRVVEIAAVEDQRRLQHLAQALEVGAAELLPLGDDGERIGTLRPPRRRCAPVRSRSVPA